MFVFLQHGTKKRLWSWSVSYSSVDSYTFYLFGSNIRGTVTQSWVLGGYFILPGKRIFQPFFHNSLPILLHVNFNNFHSWVKTFLNILIIIFINIHRDSISIHEQTSLHLLLVLFLLPPDTAGYPADQEVPPPVHRDAGHSIKIESVDPDNPEPVERVEPEEDDEDDDDGATSVTIVDNIGLRKIMVVPLSLTVIPMPEENVK